MEMNMQTKVEEHWHIRKPAVEGDAGMVASQHYLASDVGAKVLEKGGNAMDAAIAAGLAIGAVEPWMSGLGGGGYTLMYVAKENKVHVIEYGMRAPLAARAEDYPLALGGENSAESFNWPAVTGDTNIHGPLAAAVPGYVKGVAAALEEFGTLSWGKVIEPACELAEQGLPIDWFSANMINSFARSLISYPETRRVYLADGLPPTANNDGSVGTLPLGELAHTYRRLQKYGPENFYSGSLARDIAADLAAAGSRITLADLKAYKAKISSSTAANYRGATVHTAGPMTAGPSLIHALELLTVKLQQTGDAPDVQTFKAYADALLQAYQYRLSHLGEGDNGEQHSPTNTTHICVADKDGNVVSHTQTIMSAFGSRVMLPKTGVLMNNGMMWFDPRPGRPNSVVGGRHPLCNMCPVIVQQADGSIFAAGACGGRKIFPAIFQLISSMVDFGMSVDDAVHQGRIDVSGTDLVTIMASLDNEIISGLRNHYPQTSVRINGVSPNLFALPQMINRSSAGQLSGGCFIPSPHAKVSVPWE
ncbi:MAG: gamma-glutamyltranspeptidase/glutathione hydrolase [Candidatus Pseudothioglobus sp.]|jgi:gamma-glutamyltranspeptidase/glutathione hydrolase